MTDIGRLLKRAAVGFERRMAGMKKSVERISSPEKIDDYTKVTSVSM